MVTAERGVTCLLYTPPPKCNLKLRASSHRTQANTTPEISTNNQYIHTQGELCKLNKSLALFSLTTSNDDPAVHTRGELCKLNKGLFFLSLTSADDPAVHTRASF